MEFVLTFECAMVVVAMENVVRLQCRGGYNEVGTGLVEGYGVGRCKNTDVGHNGGIVVVPAVALGRYVNNEAHMEVGLVLEYGLGIFGYLVVEAFSGVVGAGYGGIVLAHSYTLSATYTLIVVNYGFTVYDLHRIMTAVFLTNPATDAVSLIDTRL